MFGISGECEWVYGIDREFKGLRSGKAGGNLGDE